MAVKKSKDDGSSIKLFYCTKHDFGPASRNSIRYNEHIAESKGRCKWEKYDPIKHNPKYESAFVTPDQDEEEKLTPTQKVLNFAQSHILKTVRSFSNNTNVYGVIRINEKYRVLFLGSTECRQWLKSTYYDYCGKVHGNDLYKNALEIIIARAITNQIPTETIHNRICFKDDEIFYNLCNDDYEIVKISKDGYTIIRNDLDNPMFRRKSNPLPQTKPKKYTKRNPLNELAQLLRIRTENRQTFIVHLVSFFFEKYPTPIMIVHGEQGTAKSTITSTVKKIVDPSPENKNGMPDNVDNTNIHFFNRYLANFDNVSYITKDLSDNMCKAITGNTHNKRELFTDDNEVILTIKARILLNGITPNIEYPDLMDRSIFYESKFIPKNERLTEKEFNKKIDELLPFLMEQIFNTLSNVLKIIDTVETEITYKERMADFTVLGECISRVLGYDDFSFIESYAENLKSNSFNAVEAYPIINIIRDIAQSKEKDFEITCSDLYDQITKYAYEHNINTNSKNSKFPKSERELTKQIVNVNPTFRSIGYEVIDYKYTKRDGKFPKSSRIFKIRSLGSINFDDTSITNNNNNTQNEKSREPKNQRTKPENQAQNHTKCGSLDDNRKRTKEPAKRTKKSTKNDDGSLKSSMVLSGNNVKEPENEKFRHKNDDGSLVPVVPSKTQLSESQQKPKQNKKGHTKIVKNLEKAKQYLRKSGFEIWNNGTVRCKSCNAKMDIPSAINHNCHKKKERAKP